MADFQEALTRYVSRADAEARVEASGRRLQLQAEADAEAQKRAVLMNKLLAKVPRGRTLSMEEAKAIFREELKNEESVNT